MIVCKTFIGQPEILSSSNAYISNTSSFYYISNKLLS